MAQHSARTVGLCLQEVWSEYSLAIVASGVHALRARGARVLVFVGIAPRFLLPIPGRRFESKLNGLIIATQDPFFGEPCPWPLGTEPPLPVVTVGACLNGTPSVMVDNERGIRDAVRHLVRLGRRRIGFVRGPKGNDDAEGRFHGFRQALAEFNVSFDPNLVAAGAFSEASGHHAVKLFIDERGLMPDAIIASDDQTAIGVLGGLQRRGLRVPGDVSLIGFDDISDAQAAPVALTTIRQPIRKLMDCAGDLLLQQMAARTSPETVRVRGELVIRESCGASAEAESEPDEPIGEGLGDWIARHRGRLSERLLEVLGEHAVSTQNLSALLDDFEKNFWSATFLSHFGRLIDNCSEPGELMRWHRALSILRQELLAPLRHDARGLRRLEDTLHEAVTRLMQAMQYAHARIIRSEAHQEVELNRLTNQLLAAAHAGAVVQALQQEESILGFRGIHLAAYDEDPGWSRLLVSTRLPGEQVRFRTDQILPDGVADNAPCVFVQELVRGNQKFGRVLVEADPEPLRWLHYFAAQLAATLDRLRSGAGSLAEAFTYEHSQSGTKPPLMIGRYRLRDRIGIGGMGTVFLAETEVLPGVKRKVALKLLHHGAPGVDADGTVGQLIEEVRVAAAVQHPNVVPVLEIERHETGIYLVMEYVQGDSLAGLLERAERSGQAVPLPILGRILIDMLSGLHAAHELKGADEAPLHLVHRDVSPQNILIGIDGVSRLTDFGIAKTKVSSVTGTGILKGKLHYMAPEQALGESLDRRCDIWSSGVVAWEAVAGQRLHGQHVEVQVLLSIISRPPPPIRSIRKDVPEEIEVAVVKALQVDPGQRYSTAAEFRSALLDAWRVSGGLADYEAVSSYVRDLIARTTEPGDVQRVQSSA